MSDWDVIIVKFASKCLQESGYEKQTNDYMIKNSPRSPSHRNLSKTPFLPAIPSVFEVWTGAAPTPGHARGDCVSTEGGNNCAHESLLRSILVAYQTAKKKKPELATVQSLFHCDLHLKNLFALLELCKGLNSSCLYLTQSSITKKKKKRLLTDDST